MMGGLWHRLTREPISRRNLAQLPARTVRGASQKTSIVFADVTQEHAALIARDWCAFWNTSVWGGRTVDREEAEGLERAWIETAGRVLLPGIRETLRDAVVFNSAIAQGMLAVERLTAKAIHDAGGAAMSGGGVLFWSDLTGLVFVVVQCPP